MPDLECVSSPRFYFSPIDRDSWEAAFFPLFFSSSSSRRGTLDDDYVADSIKSIRDKKGLNANEIRISLVGTERNAR